MNSCCYCCDNRENDKVKVEESEQRLDKILEEIKQTKQRAKAV